MLGNDAATNHALLVHQNLARARALLRAAGYAHGFSVKLTYDVGVTFDSVLFDPIAAKLQNDLAKVGIHVVLQPEQDSVLLPAYRAQKLQMVLYNWGVDYPDPNDYAGPFSPGGGPAKRMFYTWDKHLTNVVTQADSTSDRDQRAALYPLAHLARLARERGCGRLEWAVLNWNTPSIDFYKGLGAVPLSDWIVFRLTAEALEALAGT